MSFENVFTKENLDNYLKELAKEFRKLNGKAMPAEIILIGGAAVLEGYGFREITADVDAVIHASSAMKDAINRVGDKYGLPNGWLNSDFMKTDSYTPKLNEFSVYYKTFYGVLEVRTIKAEYLIAMKLKSGRKYKNDLSDIVGILAEHEKRNDPITLEKVQKAVNDLYGGWDSFPSDSKQFIETTLREQNYSEIYESVRNEEKHSREILLQFDEKYPNVTKESNVDEILKSLREKLK